MRLYKRGVIMGRVSMHLHTWIAKTVIRLQTRGKEGIRAETPPPGGVSASVADQKL